MTLEAIRKAKHFAEKALWEYHTVNPEGGDPKIVAELKDKIESWGLQEAEAAITENDLYLVIMSTTEEDKPTLRAMERLAEEFGWHFKLPTL